MIVDFVQGTFVWQDRMTVKKIEPTVAIKISYKFGWGEN